MSKRRIKNNIPKPNYNGKFRNIHGVLRNFEGFMVFSVINNDGVTYKLTNIIDLEIIKPNREGRRGFNKRYLNILENRVIDDNFKGDLFMYCTHQKEQKLLPISEFTINRANTQYYRVNNDGFPLQPYCKESKKLYQNSKGNKLRTKTQLLEGSMGSRTRGLITELYSNNKPPSICEIFKTFGGKCFSSGKQLDIKNRESYEIDHLMPASGYWPLDKKNAVLLSKEENQRKNDTHPLKFYGEEKLKKLCVILDIEYTSFKDYNYILNDDVLFKFNQEFEKVMNSWFIKKRSKSFKKYLKKEIKRIESKDVYKRHTDLIHKMKKYEEKI